MKAGWFNAPGRFADPSKSGAKAIFKVERIERDADCTTFHGVYVMSREKGTIKLANHTEVREV